MRTRIRTKTTRIPTRTKIINNNEENKKSALFTSARNLQAARAREELIFKRSTNAEGVTSFICDKEE